MDCFNFYFKSVKIEWDVEVSKILAENIVIAELSEENQHSFVSNFYKFLEKKLKNIILLNSRRKNHSQFALVNLARSVFY